MPALSEIRGRFKTLTFDCYGTLIDWKGGLAGSFLEIFGPAALSRQQDLFALYVEIEAHVESGPYRPYREILNEVVGRLGRRIGKKLTAKRRYLLPELLPTWKPFADTNEALRRLKKKFRLGVLSNIDRDLFARTATHFSIPFDFVITADDVASYKPAQGHFVRMLKEHGPKENVLHVAQSQFHDGRPANSLGIAFAWINRYNEAADSNVVSTGTYPDLKTLADALLA